MVTGPALRICASLLETCAAVFIVYNDFVWVVPDLHYGAFILSVFAITGYSIICWLWHHCSSDSYNLLLASNSPLCWGGNFSMWYAEFETGLQYETVICSIILSDWSLLLLTRIPNSMLISWFCSSAVVFGSLAAETVLLFEYLFAFVFVTQNKALLEVAQKKVVIVSWGAARVTLSSFCGASRWYRLTTSVKCPSKGKAEEILFLLFPNKGLSWQ